MSYSEAYRDWCEKTTRMNNWLNEHPDSPAFLAGLDQIETRKPVKCVSCLGLGWTGSSYSCTDCNGTGCEL